MAKKTSEKNRKKPSAGSIVSSALHGRWLSMRFFGRHWAVILALVVMILVYITNRYQCMTAMETIQQLEKELMVVKTERIRQKSTYMSNIRESAMQQRIDNQNLNLQIRERPPYKITIDK